MGAVSRMATTTAAAGVAFPPDAATTAPFLFEACRMKRFKLLFLLLALAGGLTAAGWQFAGGGIEVLQRQRTRISDFGGIAGDGKDDSAAVIRCRQAAIAMGTYEVFVDGMYEIASTNALHPRMQADGTFADPSTNPSYGITFRGVSMNYSGFILQHDDVEDRWFYNAEDHPGWNRVVFEDLWFQSNLPNNTGAATYDAAFCAKTNGFNMWAAVTTPSILPAGEPAGVDKEFKFIRCRFNGLGTPHSWTGETNTDTTRFDSCQFNNCGTSILDNVNALEIVYSQCNIWSAVDQFRIEANGGNGKGGAGAIALRDCDLIINNVDGDTDNHYTLRIDSNADFYRVWLFDQCRWELRGPEARILYWVKDSATGSPTNSHVAFRDCDLSVQQQNQASYGGGGADTDGMRAIVVQGPNTHTIFDGTYFADQLAFEFANVNTSNITAFSYQPFVELKDCAIPEKFLSRLNTAHDAEDTTRGLVARIALSNGYGRVKATNCTIRDPVPPERMAVDFDYGADSATRGEPGITRKRVYFKTQAGPWPSWSGGVAASERTVLLPENAKIVACGIDKAAGGSAITLIQYRIGPDDKSSTYCATGPIRADGHHRSVTNESTNPSIFPIRVGSDINLRRVRLWMGPVEHAGTTSSGEAWVEYE